MLTVSSAVEQVVFSSDFAIEGLCTGCLNLSAYAEVIKPQVAALIKKPVQKGSVVVALARLSNRYRRERPRSADYQIYNLVSRSGLTEITYPKSAKLQKQLADTFKWPDVQKAPFFVSRIGQGEISIITHDTLAQSIQSALNDHEPTLCLSELSSLTLQVTVDTVEMPHQSYMIIKQLALRNINCIEYITSPSELTLILHNSDVKNSFVILHDKFLIGS